MKKLMSIIAITFLFSCSHKPNMKTVKANAEQMIKLQLNNPKSFEFLSIRIIDTVTYSSGKTSFTYSYNFNVNNQIYNTYLQTIENDSIINIAENTHQLFITPKDFPDYKPIK